MAGKLGRFQMLGFQHWKGQGQALVKLGKIEGILQMSVKIVRDNIEITYRVISYKHCNAQGMKQLYYNLYNYSGDYNNYIIMNIISPRVPNIILTVKLV